MTFASEGSRISPAWPRIMAGRYVVPLWRLKTSVVGASQLKAQKMGSKGFVGTGPVGLAPTPTPRAATYMS